jgi:hypothetical protein
MYAALFSSTEEEMDANDLFSDLPSLSHDPMAFALQRSTERQTDDSLFFPIRRIIVGDGIVQFVLFPLTIR